MRFILIIILFNFNIVLWAQDFEEFSETGDSATTESDVDSWGDGESAFEDFADDDEAFEDFADDSKPEAAQQKSEPAPQKESEKQWAEEEPAGDDVEIEEDQVAKDVLEPPVQEQVIIEEPPVPEPEIIEPEPLPTTEVVQTDEPDVEYENKIFEIYKLYQTEATTDQKWLELFGSSVQEKYTIQSGDNLWSISKTFFGDGHYWPKVWSLNKDIRNPHVIEKDHVIRFILGSASSEPRFSISESSDEELQQDQEDYYEEEDIDLPPPTIISRPVVRNIPPSLPSWQLTPDDEAQQQLDFRSTNKVAVHSEGKTILTSYLDSQKPQSLGYISGSETSTIIVSLFQYVQVRLKPGTGKIGRILTVLDDREAVNEEEMDKEKTPIKVKFLGQIKLVERLEDYKEEEGPRWEMYRAYVVNAIQNINIGSMLSLDPLVYKAADLKGPKGAGRAQIIGGEKGPSTTLFTLGSKIYLDQGSRQGFQEGQIFTVYTNPKVRDRVGRNSIAKVRLIDVRDRFSTAIVVNATQEVFKGDWVEGESPAPITSEIQGPEPEEENEYSVGEDVVFESEDFEEAPVSEEITKEAQENSEEVEESDEEQEAYSQKGADEDQEEWEEEGESDDSGFDEEFEEYEEF